MTEGDIQARIMKRLRAEGYYCIKIVQATASGLPDIVALKPDEVLFVEVKRPGERTSRIQRYRHEELRAQGFAVKVMTQ
jgi:Holliday junction resolvase